MKINRSFEGVSVKIFLKTNTLFLTCFSASALCALSHRAQTSKKIYINGYEKYIKKYED